MRYGSLHVRIVLLASMLVASVAHGAHDDSATLLAQARAELAAVEGAAAEAAREAGFVEGVRERFTAGEAVARPDLEALVQRLSAAKRRLERAARLARETPPPRSPLELSMQPDWPPNYDDRFYAVLAEQRTLRAEATAALHAVRDADKLAALMVALERAAAARARASQHAQAASAGRARLQRIVRAIRSAAQREAEPELQRALAAAAEAAAQARTQAARARADAVSLRRLSGAPLESAPRVLATYERTVTRVRDALHDLYATWERLAPLHHMAVRYRVQEALRALPPDASTADVRNAVLSSEADPPMMD